MIKINHLSKKFGNLEVLKDINLDIEEGEVDVYKRQRYDD